MRKEFCMLKYLIDNICSHSMSKAKFARSWLITSFNKYLLSLFKFKAIKRDKVEKIFTFVSLQIECQ